MSMSTRSKNKAEIFISKAVTTKIIGKGAFGVIFKAGKYEEKDAVVKQVLCARDDGIEAAINEIDVHKKLSKLNSEHIIELFDYRAMRASDFYVIMEHASGGDLHQNAVLKQVSPAKIQNYFKMIIDGLSFMHKNNVAHCDIKARNLLLTKDNVVKIGDFGKAIELKSKSALVDSRLAIGTLNHSAPELFAFAGCKVKPYPLDVWSAGVVLMQMSVASDETWANVEKDPIYKRWKIVANGGNPSTKDIWRNVDRYTLNLLKNILCEDVKKRFTIAKILKDDYFKQKFAT